MTSHPHDTSAPGATAPPDPVVLSMRAVTCRSGNACADASRAAAGASTAPVITAPTTAAHTTRPAPRLVNPRMRDLRRRHRRHARGMLRRPGAVCA